MSAKTWPGQAEAATWGAVSSRAPVPWHGLSNANAVLMGEEQRGLTVPLALSFVLLNLTPLRGNQDFISSKNLNDLKKMH